MEVVEAQSKKYELVSMRSDPMYDGWKASIDEVKKFIIAKNLIIYGGTAIDFALRLKGDCIYPDDMLAVPDLDVYSPDPVNHAYELAEILLKQGYDEVRAIVAMYVRTMRIDIGGKHIAADISFVPRAVFDRLPYIEYEGMRVIHPDFQRIDLHSSLAFPFDFAPREVIFDRWRKDISRYNQMWKAYPVDAKPPKDEGRELVVAESYTRWVFHGFAAYALLYTALEALVKKHGVDRSALKDIIKARFKPDGERIRFTSPVGRIEFLHFEPSEVLLAHKLCNVKHYAGVMGAIPKRAICNNVTESNIQLVVHSTAHRMVCIAPVVIDKARYKCAGAQYLLYYFMAAAYNVEHIDGKDADVKSMRDLYLSYYVSTLRMINVAEKIYAKDIDSMSDEDLNKSIFLPNVYVYGNSNESENYEINIGQIHMALGMSKDEPRLPTNYYPGRGHGRPQFDYEASPYFIKDGRELSE